VKAANHEVLGSSEAAKSHPAPEATPHSWALASSIISHGVALALTYDKLSDYCRLRFQIEFNLRGAKQYRGLEDFVNAFETAVANAANQSLGLCRVHEERQYER
jgi:hypothetical protein